MEYLAYFFAGAFLCNCIPHLAAGLQGKQFPTPFAKPRGVGRSSALVNFLWGSLNTLIGVSLLVIQPFHPGINATTMVFMAGWLSLGTYLSVHFAKVLNR